MDNEAFPKKKTAEETLAYALEQLEEFNEHMGDARFAFASFVDYFKSYLIKSGTVDKEKLK